MINLLEKKSKKRSDTIKELKYNILHLMTLYFLEIQPHTLKS